jgi:hypothetical protein
MFPHSSEAQLYAVERKVRLPIFPQKKKSILKDRIIPCNRINKRGTHPYIENKHAEKRLQSREYGMP